MRSVRDDGFKGREVKSVIDFPIFRYPPLLIMIIYGGTAYILTNQRHTVFYVGVAASVSFRVDQHREKFYPKSFTARYNVDKLVYYEIFYSIEEAIDREKQLKKYSRLKKVKLINEKNPEWKDLYDEVRYL